MKNLIIVILLFATCNVYGQATDSLEFDANPEGYNTKLLKVEFFSPLTGNLTIGYENYTGNGISWETKVGIIGAGKNIDGQKGAFLKFGPKFKISPDYVTKDMRASHPLKGTYLKPELFVAYFTGENYYDYVANENVKQSVSAFALMLNFGRQVVFNNKFSVDWYVGIGYGVSKDEYGGYQYGMIGGYNEVPIALSGGLTLGILLN
jgi:hypothetical protein